MARLRESLTSCLCCLLLAAWACGAAAAAGAPAAAAGTGSGIDVGEGACAGGVIPDDGSAETGWGFVPSVQVGQYVQRFHLSDLPARRPEEVCVCWLRTGADVDLDFDLVLYGENDEGAPGPEPLATLRAVAEEVPQGILGRFYCYDFGGPPSLPADGNVFVGARWNASSDPLFFLCADNSPETPIVDTYYSFDGGESWESVLESGDPIFANHRATMIRLRGIAGGLADVPALGPEGALLLAAGLAFAAALHLRRR